MQEKRYLLDIGQMLTDGGEDIFRKAFERIDSERRQKAYAIKNARAQAAAVGAGLLIQKALEDYMQGQTVKSVAQKPVLECFSVYGLLAALGRRVTEPRYRYGKNGKPYLEDYPIQFNLSHSGDFVFCGASEQEIGVDIQKLQGNCNLRLAKRFFADSEYRALEACGEEGLRCQMFFRMWVRKEAYGKLTGEGIAGAIGKNLWGGFFPGAANPSCAPGVSLREAPSMEEGYSAGIPGVPSRKAPSTGNGCPAGTAGNGSWRESDLIWEEYDMPDGYRMAVCRFRQGSAAGSDSGQQA